MPGSFDSILFEHICADVYIRHKLPLNRLNEKYGVFPDAENILAAVSEFVNWIADQACSQPFCFYQDSAASTAKFLQCLEGTGIFFKDCTLQVTVWFQDNIGDEGYSGVFDIDNTQYTVKGVPDISAMHGSSRYTVGYFKPFFKFSFNCSEKHFRRYGASTFMHELLHAYEFLNRLKMTGSVEAMKNGMTVDGKTVAHYMLENKDPDTAAVANLFYVSEKMEQNAFSAEVYVYVMSVLQRDTIFPKLAIERFKGSDIYRRVIEKPESDLKELRKITDGRRRKKILEFANYYVVYKFTDYERLMDYFEHILYKIKSRVISTVGKWIAYSNEQHTSKSKIF